MEIDIVAMGEPLLEFNATTEGSLLEARGYEVGWGGDTSNFVIASARLGKRSGYICRLGDDDFGRIFLNLWQAEGVDTKYVSLDTDASTGIYFIARHGQEHSFTYYRANSAASRLVPEDIPREYISNAKVFHTSGITQAISTTACDTVFQAIEVARQANVLVSYDPNIRPLLWNLPRARAIVLGTLRQVDIAFPSLEDAKYILGCDNPEEIVKELRALGPIIIALKLGDEGALIATQEELYKIEPVSVDVQDTTGAGDTFAAAFLDAYLDGCLPIECGRFANAAAALVTTGWGAVTPIPSREEVEKLLR